MQIIDSIYNENEITDLINTSKPITVYQFKVLSIKDKYGWASIVVKVEESEISIKYSSIMFDLSYFIGFLTELTDLKEDIVLDIDNEGSQPIFYANTYTQDKIRFLFASDYDLYASFCKDEIDDYEPKDYKVEFDIIIDKRNLLEEFYKIISPYIDSYNGKHHDKYGDNPLNIGKAKECLNKIKAFIES